MLPEWKQRQITQKRIEQSKSRFVGLCATAVGFILILVSILTRNKFNVGNGLMVLMIPIFGACVFGVIIGAFQFIKVATDVVMNFILFFCIGYDLDKLNKVLTKNL